MKKEINSPAIPRAIGPFSPAIEVNGMVFISGQIAMDPATGEFRSDSIEKQTRLVLFNLRSIIEAAGCSVSDIVKCTVYLKDLNDYNGMNDVYGEFFSPPYPSRVALQVARLPMDARVEIEAVAVKQA